MRNILINIILLAIFLFSSASIGLAQTDTLWSAVVTTTTNPVFYNAIEHSSGDFILVGSSDLSNQNPDFFAARINPNGTVVWFRSYEEPLAESAYAVAEVEGGNIIISGPGQETNSVKVMKITANGDSLWSRSYFGGGSAAAYGITPLFDGNLAIVGHRIAQNGHSDLWLLKCDTNGDTLWTRTYGGENIDIGYRITEREDRSLVIGGYTQSFGSGNYDMWLLRMDSLGNQLSTASYGTFAADLCYNLSDADSVIYLCGRSMGTGVNQGYLAKTDHQGDSIWVHSYAHNTGEEQLRGACARETGGVICVGWSGTSSATQRCLVSTITAGGTEEWNWILGPQGGGLYGIVRASTGGFLAFGQITVNSVRKGYVLRLSVNRGITGVVRELGSSTPVAGARIGVVGHPQWTTTDLQGHYRLGIEGGTYDFTVSGACISSDTLRQIVVLPDTMVTVDFQAGRPHYGSWQTSINVMVGNHSVSTVPLHIANSGNGGLTYRITAECISPTSSWFSVVPDSGIVPASDTLAVQVRFTPDSLVNITQDCYGIISITTNSCPGGSNEIPVFMVVTDADDHLVSLPNTYSLSAYPNPFNPTTMISFTLPQTGSVKLTVFDITGRVVTTLADEMFSAGEHHFPLHASMLASGLYFVHLESKDFSSTQKLMLLK